MKTLTKLIFVAAMALSLTACVGEPKQSAKSAQAQKAKDAANSINFAENSEIENIKRRLELTSNPGAIGFVLLMNQAGQPIMYTGVKGKITSGSKRLTEPDRSGSWGAGQNNVVRAAPSDEGTYGSSDSYIYFWTTNGQYIQWSGSYLYSDKPLRVKIEPLVVSSQMRE